MRKWISICSAAVAVVLVLAGCGAQAAEEAVLPPTRYGKWDVDAELNNCYTLEEGAAAADVVARVRVGDWLSETERATYFEADVLDCYKGTIPETFILKQDGSSSSTFDRYPIFTDGDELLVFLSAAVQTVDEDPYWENMYWIIGSYTSVLDVFYDDTGNRYYADRFGVLIQTDSTNPVSAEITAEVMENAVEIDPVLGELSYKTILPASDVETRIAVQLASN